eukprot:1903987-Pleurochrysis_carterae.AAC.1
MRNQTAIGKLRCRQACSLAPKIAAIRFATSELGRCIRESVEVDRRRLSRQRSAARKVDLAVGRHRAPATELPPAVRPAGPQVSKDKCFHRSRRRRW